MFQTSQYQNSPDNICFSDGIFWFFYLLPGRRKLEQLKITSYKNAYKKIIIVYDCGHVWSLLDYWSTRPSHNHISSIRRTHFSKYRKTKQFSNKTVIATGVIVGLVESRGSLMTPVLFSTTSTNFTQKLS